MVSLPVQADTGIHPENGLKLLDSFLVLQTLSKFYKHLSFRLNAKQNTRINEVCRYIYNQWLEGTGVQILNVLRKTDKVQFSIHNVAP